MNNKVKKKFATNDKLSNHGYKDKIRNRIVTVQVLVNINYGPVLCMYRAKTLRTIILLS